MSFSLLVSRAPLSTRTNMTSSRSTRSPAWSWWRSMWSLWRRGRRSSKTTPNNWGRSRSWCGSTVCLKCLCASVSLKAAHTVSVCEIVCVSVFAWVYFRRLFINCLWGLMTTLGQNLTCLWNTGLILQLQCALSLSLFSLSLSFSLSLHPWSSLSHAVVFQRAGRHLWLCWALLERRGSGSRLAHDIQDVVRGRVKEGRTAISISL